MPFAGIAFLWFIGVLRDRLGHQEDSFFATVFFGSALLFLAMLFASAAVMDGLNRLFSNDSAPLRVLRDLGLGLVDRAPALKRFFVSEAAGATGTVPHLLNGQRP